MAGRVIWMADTKRCSRARLVVISNQNDVIKKATRLNFFMPMTVVGLGIKRR